MTKNYTLDDYCELIEDYYDNCDALDICVTTATNRLFDCRALRDSLVLFTETALRRARRMRSYDDEQVYVIRQLEKELEELKCLADDEFKIKEQEKKEYVPCLCRTKGLPLEKIEQELIKMIENRPEYVSKNYVDVYINLVQAILNGLKIKGDK